MINEQSLILQTVTKFHDDDFMQTIIMAIFSTGAVRLPVFPMGIQTKKETIWMLWSIATKQIKNIKTFRF